jgi:ABC-type transport system involved in multi-copper enzyme maturation permease subunit
MSDWRHRLRRIVLNPLVAKDGLSRMRSWRAPATIAVYLGLLGLFGCLVFRVSLAAIGRAGGFAQVGSSAFTAMAMLQLALVCLFTPAVAAGAVSAERERQTLDVLMVSWMSPLSVVWGKLVASIAFVLLLVTAAQPLFATVFLFGGVDFQQFLVTQSLTATTSVAVGAVSILLSVLVRRTLVSTVISYALTFAGTVGTWVLGALLTFTTASRPVTAGPPFAPQPHPLLYVNPIQAMLAALQVPTGMAIPLGRTVQSYGVRGAAAPAVTVPALDLWQATMLAELGVVVVCVAAAVLLLRGRRPLLPLHGRDAEETPQPQG